MCTYPDCVEGDSKLLNSWEDWLVHERVNHRVEYLCAEHSALGFHDRAAYSAHVLDQHPSEAERLLNPAEIGKRACPIPRPDRVCPLCSYDTAEWTDMEEHLAFHLESLALLALPLATGLEVDIDQQKASVQVEQGAEGKRGSRDGDCGSTPSTTTSQPDGPDIGEPFDQVTVPDGEDPSWGMVADWFSGATGGLNQKATSETGSTAVPIPATEPGIPDPEPDGDHVQEVQGPHDNLNSVLTFLARGDLLSLMTF